MMAIAGGSQEGVGVSIDSFRGCCPYVGTVVGVHMLLGSLLLLREFGDPAHGVRNSGGARGQASYLKWLILLWWPMFDHSSWL